MNQIIWFFKILAVAAGPEIPVPLEFLALALLIPLCVCLVLRLSRCLWPDEELALALMPALALILFLLSVHVSSLIAHSFRLGLAVGSAVFITGLVLANFFVRKAPESPPSRALNRSFFIVFGYSAVTLLFMLPLFVALDSHDRLTGVGHFTFVSEIVNGVYPLKNPFFPEQNLRYHFGVDVLAASLVSIFRLRVDVALSVVTIGLWFYLLQLAGVFGRRFCGDRTGLVSAFAVSVSGGIPMVCEIFNPGAAPSWIGFSETCAVNSFATNPPLVSYLFQPPYAFGMALFLFGFLFLHLCEQEASRANPRWGVAALLGLFVSTLALAHVVIFLVLVASAMMTACVRKFLNPKYRLTFILLPTGLGILAATQLGGFFADRSNASASELPLAFNNAGHAREWLASLEWNLITFGLIGFLGLLGLFRYWRRTESGQDVFIRLCVVLAMTMVMVNVVHYKSSWDIVKFATAASLCLALLSIPTLIALAQSRIVFGSLALILAFNPGFYLWQFWPKAAEEIVSGANTKFAWRRLPQPDRDVIEFLRTRVTADDLLYVRPSVYDRYMYWGGLSTVWLNPSEAKAHGISQERIDRRIRSLTPPLAASRFIAEGVTYFVIAPSDAVDGLDSAVTSGGVELVATFSPLKLYKIKADRTETKGAREYSQSDQMDPERRNVEHPTLPLSIGR